MATAYWHMNAQNLAAARRSRQRKLTRHEGLRLAVIERPKDGWSTACACRVRVAQRTNFSWPPQSRTCENWQSWCG